MLRRGDVVRGEAGARAEVGGGDVGGGGLRGVVRRRAPVQADGRRRGRRVDRRAQEPGGLEGLAVPAGQELGVGGGRCILSLRGVARVSS